MESIHVIGTCYPISRGFLAGKTSTLTLHSPQYSTMGFAHLRAPFHFKKHFSRSKSTASGLPALPGHGHPEDSENPNYPSAANPKASRFSTATHAAKNALKTTLVIAKEATAGLPLPVQGVIGGVISIIEVAEVIIPCYMIVCYCYWLLPSKRSPTRRHWSLWTIDAEFLSILWSIP